MRLVLPFAIVVTAVITAGNALAQGPAMQRSGSPEAPGQTAPGGQVPTIGQQSTVAPLDSGNEPARAPGAAGPRGADMPLSGTNSGTTTTYAPAKPQEEVRWPCAQPRVSSISVGTIWAGPDPAQGKGWDDDNDLAALAQKLASRRTPLDEADPLIDAFAKKAGADKDKQLTRLFVGVLAIINENRNQILGGIMRYAQGQERLAERMRDESDKISEAQSEASAEGLGVAAQQTNRDFAWDQRIFKERRQALSYVCETPSLLERRAYEIGKRIQAQL